MITTVLLSILVLGLLFAGMAVGVILAQKPIRGSCGGMAALGLKDRCELCGGDPNRCDNSLQQDGEAPSPAPLARDLTPR